MALADDLRDALARGHRRQPMLIEGDILEDVVAEDGAAENGAAAAGTMAAAVLVGVVDHPEPTVILTLRSETMRRHPGQVAFPGGRIDPQDDGPVDAALREAEEEIGLPRALVDIIGLADPYRTITGFEVTPVIGIVPPGLALTPDPEEVAAIFEVPFRHLLDPAHHHVRSGHYRGRERQYFEIEYRDHRIWGATAAMIVNLGRRLQAEAAVS